MINVLIADDQKFVRKTLESYLELESDLNVVGFAENGEIAIDRVATLKPDVVLMDIEMPVMDGFTATKAIAERFSDTRVLMLSSYDKKQDVTRALDLGAKGYCLKNTTAKELSDAIRYVHEGYFQLALELVEKHFARLTVPNLDSKSNAELNNKLDVVDAVLAKIEQKIRSLKKLTPHNLNQTIEDIVKQEIVIQNEKDINLQFKLDRLKYRLSQREKTISLVLKAQLALNIGLVAAIGILSYFVFSSP